MVRALLICLPIELLPAVLSTGFVPRYAYLASALLAIALALGIQHGGGRGRGRYAVLVLLGMWIYDSTDDLREIRCAGRDIDRIVTKTAELRAEIGPEIQITIADVPT